MKTALILVGGAMRGISAGAAFRKNPMALYVGATDVAAGKSACQRLDDGGDGDICWLRESASVPLVSGPVQIGRFRLMFLHQMEPSDLAIQCEIPGSCPRWE